MTGHRLLMLAIFLWRDCCIFAEEGKSCSVEILRSCNQEETCEQIQFNSTEGICKCKKDYGESVNQGLCAFPTRSGSNTSGDFSTGVSASAIAVGLLVPVISIVIIGGIVVAFKRYRWIHRFRTQAHQLTVRNYDTVLVGGHDDEPSVG